ncbi:MAG TPA: 50S ribosomal protein L7ae [Clostridiales bacterium]|nr:50S ribosomal protein L7ae [Clostridiales bacterium]
MMNERIFSLLGIAQRAGKLLSGYELCLAAIKTKKARAAIISGDSADNTRKKFIGLCKNYNVPYIIYGDKYTLGKSIGKYRRTVLVITDKGLADAILDKYYSG